METPSRQSRWAQRVRAKLIWILGGRCMDCGTTQNLTFDCIVPRGGKHHRMSSAQRMTFYTREMKAGNLQVLCHACNVRKSNKPKGKYSHSPLPALPPQELSDEEVRLLELQKYTRCPAQY